MLLGCVGGALSAQPSKLHLVRSGLETVEISFGTATDFNPDAKEASGPKSNGLGASATGVLINRKNGR